MAFAARADDGGLHRPNFRDVGGDVWLITDRFQTAQAQFSAEFGKQLRAGFSFQLGVSWAGETPRGTRVGSILGGGGLLGAWLFAKPVALVISSDFDGQTRGAPLFIARAQLRVLFHDGPCGYEALIGPDWIEPLAIDPVHVRPGGGIALAFGTGCHR
jgi:hypothetical protein